VIWGMTEQAESVGGCACRALRGDVAAVGADALMTG